MATAHWSRPATRTSIIDKLVEGVDRYNPQNVEILEDYLYQQMKNGEYDCLSNLAILKLYQFNPELYNGDVVVNILAKALTATPAADFNLCLALLCERPVEAQSDETDPFPLYLPQLQFLYQLLRTCKFPLFWEIYRSPDSSNLRDNYIAEVYGFEDTIRENVIAKIVSSTFTRIGKQRLETYLDLTGPEFDAMLEKLGWTVDSKGGVVITPNPDNQIQATVLREDIQLPQLSKIIAHAQSA
ncbi:hypothetical protein FRC04_004708 [Tulasnella sp. 424]|nr:hypothetical protein FRC04_004708 [Tulasnella sp. 424]KAG8963635.1 hypothetical protein FRC05_004569 [Tulasnella sp. 425]